MSKALKTLVAGGMVGALAWAVREHLEGQDIAKARVIPASTRKASSSGSNRARDALAGGLKALIDNFDFDAPATPKRPQPTIKPAPARPQTATAGQFRPSGRTGNVGPLLAIIRKHESRGNYNAVWGRIASKHRPPKALTRMTISEVLAWQDSIDRLYNSEAAGAYQILEDTLRGLFRTAGLKGSDLYSIANQDRLAVALLNRRGLARYRSGQLTDVQFGQQLSQEWASFPAQTRDKKGRPATGQSYYAGDGLNKSLTSKAEVLAAIRNI